MHASWSSVRSNPVGSVHASPSTLAAHAAAGGCAPRYPFTIQLTREPADTVVPPLRLKIDPGSKTTGIAVVNEASGEVVWAAEVQHRGQLVKERLDQRRVCRRSRRQRHTRYRKPRFANRTRPKGWLPPSLETRIANVLTWVARIEHWCPIAALSQELVRFDTVRHEAASLIVRHNDRTCCSINSTLGGTAARQQTVESPLTMHPQP